MSSGQEVEILARLGHCLREEGWAVDVLPDTLCISRPGWDEHSRQELAMASGIGEIQRGGRKFFAVAQEHRDTAGDLVKYSIKLLDRNRTALHSWDLDTKRGQHRHVYAEGAKLDDHEPHEGSIEDIAREMHDLMVSKES